MQTVDAERARQTRGSAPNIRHYGAIAIATAFLALHLPFLPASLEDVDSINFALGIRHFDVAQHQPHPPGYPLFVAVAKTVNIVVGDEAKALSVVSTVCGACAVPALLVLYRRIDPRAPAGPWPLVATLLTVTAPLYWLTAARPLSDTAGLATATAVQALTLAATSSRGIAAAAFLAAIASGMRSQIAWLTVPLLVLAIARLPGVERGRAARAAAPAFVIGGLVWGIPLVVLSGGPTSYWHALLNQGTEDLSGIRMLSTTPTLRQSWLAFYNTFVAPWAIAWTAGAVLLLTTVGLVRMFRRSRPALITLGAAFGPYLVFDLFFQESITTRYALPILVPVVYLALLGISTAGWRAGLVAAIALAMFNAYVGGTSVAAYSAAPAPAFRLLADMRQSAADMREKPVVATDRREEFDLRRPIVWIGDATPAVGARLPAPPQHEWLELVNYWNSGGRAPVWFVADPLRTDIDMVQHSHPRQYRWAVPYPVLLGGVRPNEMDWYQISQPAWYLGPGWALTPEVAGVSEFDQSGLSHGPISGWVRLNGLDGGAVVIGGRNFEPALRPQLAIVLGDRKLAEFTLAPGTFLTTTRVSWSVVASPMDYAKITVRVTPPSQVGIEQFDVFNGVDNRPVFGFGEGWNEQEYTPATGLRWRWLSERGRLQAISRGGPLTLHVEGESPRRYFSRPSRFVVRTGDGVVFERMLSSDFSLDVPIPSDPTTGGDQFASYSTRFITLETDQFYVPAERSRRTADRRHLGLRILRCELRPAS